MTLNLLGEESEEEFEEESKEEVGRSINISLDLLGIGGNENLEKEGKWIKMTWRLNGST